ncbi:MAG: hypothetical protein WKF80_07770, partial [Thermomicrobiales bacterium]
LNQGHDPTSHQTGMCRSSPGDPSSTWNTYSLSDAEMRALEVKIDCLIEASARMDRIDWLNVVAGAMFSYAWDITMSPDSARSLLLSTLQGIAHFYAQSFMALP